MSVFAFDGVVPVVHPTAYVHPSAVLIGDVIIGPRCYVGPCASLRGDFGRLVLEEGSNLQDSCVMHGFPGGDAVVESDGHVSHGAVLHGCRIGRNAMVGINAVIMDEAVIGEGCIVAALSYVKPGFSSPPRRVIAGAPAEVKRELSEIELDWKREATGTYQWLSGQCHSLLVPAEPRTEVEPDRHRTRAKPLEPLHGVRGRKDA